VNLWQKGKSDFPKVNGAVRYGNTETTFFVDRKINGTGEIKSWRKSDALNAFAGYLYGENCSRVFFWDERS
jgi:hypothetical protein